MIKTYVLFIALLIFNPILSPNDWIVLWAILLITRVGLVIGSLTVQSLPALFFKADRLVLAPMILAIPWAGLMVWIVDHPNNQDLHILGMGMAFVSVFLSYPEWVGSKERTTH